ncbi:MAG: hypothetical protein AB7W16_11970 [Candidatus Obscuribacterales bacterium]
MMIEGFFQERFYEGDSQSPHLKMFIKDTAIAKLPDQGNLHKATLAAG